jgi:hypothetical protein
VDTYERVREADLKQAAIIMASTPSRRDEE